MEWNSTKSSDGKSVKVTLQFKEPIGDNTVEYVAAAPPDFRSSFSGSALPFANPDQAFSKTPNTGNVMLNENGIGSFEIMMPNSYMIRLGTIQVPPTVFVSYTNALKQKQVANLQLCEPVPFRSMTYPSLRKDAMFYKNEMVPISTQETILRASAYPTENMTPPNFWGQRPPL